MLVQIKFGCKIFENETLTLPPPSPILDHSALLAHSAPHSATRHLLWIYLELEKVGEWERYHLITDIHTYKILEISE